MKLAKRLLTICIGYFVFVGMNLCILKDALSSDIPGSKVKPPVLLRPPLPPLIATDTPESRAVAFAKGLQSPKDRLAYWLGVYDAIGVPVIDQDGYSVGITSDDPIGPRYWQVWYASQLDLPGRGISLIDAGRLLSAGLPELNFFNFAGAPSLGSILLSDIRNAAESSDQHVRFLGKFIQERVLRGPSHIDLLDPSVTVDQVVIDLPTLQLIAWVAFRNSLLLESKGPSGFIRYLPQILSRDFHFVSIAHAQELVPIPTHTPCSEILGDKDLTYWTDWLLKRAARGVRLPGMVKAFPGFVSRIQNYLGVDPIMITKTSNGQAWINALSSALTLGMRLAAMDIDVIQEPDPLRRTKGTRNGEEGKIIFALVSRPKPLPNNDEESADANLPVNCLMSFLSSTAGITFKLPPAGRMAGVEVKLTGGQGFPDLVLFNNYRDVFGKVTDQNGELTVGITGAAQKRQMPESAKPVDKEFSIIVHAQPEAISDKTLASLFFSGLFAGVNPNLPSATSAIIDLLKTIHWNLGEYVFRLTDWSSGWEINETFDSLHFTGTSCENKKGPWKINVEGSYGGASTTGMITGTLNDAGQGIFTEEIKTFAGNVVFPVTGTYSATLSDAGADSFLRLIPLSKVGHPNEISGGGRWDFQVEGQKIAGKYNGYGQGDTVCYGELDGELEGKIHSKTWCGEGRSESTDPRIDWIFHIKPSEQSCE